MLTIGVISDTHSLLRPEAVEALQGAAHILHAGDAGKPEVLQALQAIAPLTAVRGNVDYGEWAQALPLTQAVQIGGVWIYMLHDLGKLDLDPAAAGFRLVVSGHSHQPSIEERRGVLYLNPGSAGRRRFHLPVTLAKVYLQDNNLQAEIIEIQY